MKKNIILLFGGDSDERLVSVASAQAMAEAIRPEKLWFWHKDGMIFDVSYNKLIEHERPFTDEFTPNNHPIFNNIEEAISAKSSADYVFLLGVHGGSGENGHLQKILESHGRAYTGSDAKASQIAFDKLATKEWLKNYHIKMAPHEVIETTQLEPIASRLYDFFSHHGEMILKPICGGSSLGCFFIRNKEEIGSVVDQLRKFYPKPFLLEKLIHGPELTFGVVENNHGPQGLSGTEIVVEKNHEFNYQGKYLGLGTKEVTPPRFDKALIEEAQRLAVKAHVALSLFGYSRTDMILAKDGFYYLETNTLPGLSKQSLVPQQLAVAGVSMREFLLGQIEIAIARNLHEISVVTAQRMDAPG